MKYKQIDLFPDKGQKISSNSCKCWRCQEYFPVSAVHVFSIRDIHGLVTDFQACDACYQVMMKQHDWGWC